MGVEEAVDSLHGLKDARKPLIDRLPIAYDLYYNKSIIFPARIQYFLDWLLDSFYRLLKSGSDKVTVVMREPSFWNLLKSFLLGQEPIGLGTKRKQPLLRKPILPVFSTYLGHRNTAQVDPLVKQCMEIIVNEFELCLIKSPIKSFQDFLSFADVLVDERLEILLLWARNQPNKTKVFTELRTLIIPLLKIIKSSELRERTIHEILLTSEVIGEIFSATKNESYELTNELISMGETLFFKSICDMSKSYLSSSNYRLLVIKIFVYLIPNSEGSLAGLVRILADSGIASNRDDLAWELCASVLNNIANVQMKDPLVLIEIIRIEVALLTPIFPAIIHSIHECSENWLEFLSEFARKHGEVRQIDEFLRVLVEHLRVPLPLPFLRPRLRPLLQNLYPKVLEQIIAQLSWDGSHPKLVRINSLRILKLLATINTSLVASKIEHMMDLISCSDDEIKHEFMDILEVLGERNCKAIYPFMSEDYPHSGCIIQAFLRGQTDKVPKKAIDDNQACLHYLPPLLEKGIIPLMDNVPECVFKSSLVWESLVSIDDLIRQYMGRRELISMIIRNLPEGLSLDPNLALSCLKSIDPSLTDRILVPSQILPSEIDPDFIDQLYHLGTSYTRVQLYQRSLVKKDFVIDSFVKTPELLLASSMLIKAILNDISDEQVALLSNIVLEMGNILSDGHFRLVAMISRRAKDLYQRAIEKLVLDEGQRWKLAIKFSEEGSINQIPFTFSEAVQVYVSGDILTAREVTLFLKDSSAIRTIPDFIDRDSIKYLQLVDALLLQSLEVQNIACFLLDECLLEGKIGFMTSHPTILVRLIHHRLLCGGTNIGALQKNELFDQFLLIVSKLIPLCSIPDLYPVFSSLMKFHWQHIMNRRPLFIAMLQSILLRANEEPRKVNRLLYGFANHRQADQHFYISPLVLTFVHMNLDIHIRNMLIPSMCALVSHLDQQLIALKIEGKTDKYFDLNPLNRLMCMTETDDAKVILKFLIKTYIEDYKFTGKT